MTSLPNRSENHNVILIRKATIDDAAAIHNIMVQLEFITPDDDETDIDRFNQEWIDKWKWRISNQLQYFLVAYFVSPNTNISNSSISIDKKDNSCNSNIKTSNIIGFVRGGVNYRPGSNLLRSKLFIPKHVYEIAQRHEQKIKEQQKRNQANKHTSTNSGSNSIVQNSISSSGLTIKQSINENNQITTKVHASQITKEKMQRLPLWDDQLMIDCQSTMKYNILYKDENKSENISEKNNTDTIQDTSCHVNKSNIDNDHDKNDAKEKEEKQHDVLKVMDCNQKCDKQRKIAILKKWNIVKEYDCEIINLMILPQYQRKGLGTRLIRDMVIRLEKNLQAKSFMLTTGFTNRKGRSFYHDKLKGDFVGIIKVAESVVIVVYAWNINQFLKQCQQIEDKNIAF